MNIDISIEILIVVLAAWALWKSLPRRINCDWNEVYSDFDRALSGHVDGLEGKPFAVMDWTDIHQDSALLKQFLCRKLAHVRLVGQSEHCRELQRILDTDRLEDLEIDQLSNFVTKKDQRLYLVAEGIESQRYLEFLHQYPAVRDRVLAVAFIDPILDEEWVAKHFTHKEMDVEAHVAIPYLLWGSGEYKNILKVEADPNGWRSIEVIDFGIFPEQEKWMSHSIACVLCKMMEMA